MANSYKYAEDSDQARIAALKRVNELIKRYEDIAMAGTGIFNELVKLKEILTVEGE